MVANRSGPLQAVTAVFVATAFLSTALRVYTRIVLVKAFGVDDWFMVMATLFHIMFATCVSGGVHWGTGRHMADLTDHDKLMAMRYWWLCYISYCLTMITAKISIGYFLLRLTVNKVHVWIIYIVMSLTVLTGIVFFFVVMFQCHPVSYFWDKYSQSGTCISSDIIMALTYLYSTVSAICDFTFGILPIFLIWNLNMESKTKLALIPILSMACIASTAVLVRMAYVKDFKSTDFLWATTDIAIWSDIEQGLAITAGSLATLRPLVRLIGNKLGLTIPTSAAISGGIQPSSQGLSKGPSRNHGASRNRRGPFSLVSFTQNDTTTFDDYHRMRDINSSERDVSDNSGDANRRGSIWAIAERDNESELELTVRPDKMEDIDHRSFAGGKV